MVFIFEYVLISSVVSKTYSSGGGDWSAVVIDSCKISKVIAYPRQGTQTPNWSDCHSLGFYGCLIPCNSGDQFKITINASATDNDIYVWLTSDDQTIVNTSSASPDHEYITNQVITITAPSDAKFLYVLYSSNDTVSQRLASVMKK